MKCGSDWLTSIDRATEIESGLLCRRLPTFGEPHPTFDEEQILVSIKIGGSAHA